MKYSIQCQSVCLLPAASASAQSALLSCGANGQFELSLSTEGMNIQADILRAQHVYAVCAQLDTGNKGFLTSEYTFACMQSTLYSPLLQQLRFPCMWLQGEKSSMHSLYVWVLNLPR